MQNLGGLGSESYSELLLSKAERERMSTVIFSEDGDLRDLTEDVEILRERVEGYKFRKGENFKGVKVENERLIKENTRLRAVENGMEREMCVLSHENGKLSA